jgi:hypothetical protein
LLQDLHEYTVYQKAIAIQLILLGSRQAFLYPPYTVTINVPVVFMGRYVMILRGATSLQGALEGVGPENRDLNPYINNKTVIKILLARQFEAVSNIVKMMKLLS